MQQDRLQEHMKDPRSAALGKLGGQWHPREAQAARERAEESARVVKQAIDDYLPSDTRNMMEP
jgi:hypothetical protein